MGGCDPGSSNATGDFVQYSTDRGCADLPEIVSLRFCEVLAKKAAQHFDDAYVFYTTAKSGSENLLYLKHASELGKMDRRLLEILQRSNRPLMKLGAEIALPHHERWDDSCYPSGLAGTAIPVSGRITALADVFDSLGS